MIELKQNKMWSDSLSSALGLDNPWDELEKPLRKFICFGEGGDSGGAGGGGGGEDAETDVEFGEPTADMTTAEAISSTTAADAVGGLAGIADAETAARNKTIQDILKMDPIPLGLDKPTIEFLGLQFTAAPKAAGLFGAPAYSNLGFSFSPGEFAADVVDIVNPLVGLLGRQALGLIDKDNTLGLNTQNPISEIVQAFSPFSELVGLDMNLVQENLGPLGKGIDTGKSAVVDAITGSLTGTDTAGKGISSTPTSSPVSSTPDTSDFGEIDGSGGLTGLASVVQQNPLEVRPQDEVQSSASGTSRITRRPFNFTPGRIFAQTGGGIQDLINKEPTLLDVVNQGMAMPEETIPAQRPQQFISGQQQPGGLRSTNYYTNAMQPASFYAQPQQVKNYGSIY
jgi:hypothetical protein